MLYLLALMGFIAVIYLALGILVAAAVWDVVSVRTGTEMFAHRLTEKNLYWKFICALMIVVTWPQFLAGPI